MLTKCALGFVGTTKFDIKFLVLCFFENIHFLLILKCLLHHLGLSSIDVLIYVMLLMSTLRTLTCLLILDASSLVDFV